ncbi:MAG: peptidylprolyl isomerase [Candidatus Uhrbacteria bacterium]
MKKTILLLSVLALVGAGCINSTDENLIKANDVNISDQTQSDEKPEIEGYKASWAFPGQLSDETIQNKQVRIQTEYGDIVFELFADTAPLTVSNFVYLTSNTYYNGLTFHRREEGFVIQGGDPIGNGTGGPGYKFEDEVDDEYTYDRGIVAMANSGPNTNGSQFFIMLADTPLPKAYSIFGRVIEGLDIVDQIQVGDKMNFVTLEDVE